MCQATRSRDKKRDETRQRLLDAAVRLFAAQGYDHTTSAEIAHEAGVTERTLFRHFATKADLLLGNWRDNAAALAAAMRRQPDDAPPIEVRTRRAHRLRAATRARDPAGARPDDASARGPDPRADDPQDRPLQRRRRLGRARSTTGPIRRRPRRSEGRERFRGHPAAPRLGRTSSHGDVVDHSRGRSPKASTSSRRSSTRSSHLALAGVSGEPGTAGASARTPCTTTGSSSSRCPRSSLAKYGMPSPKQHGHEADAHLVDQAEVERLLDDVGARDGDVLVAGDLPRLGDRRPRRRRRRSSSATSRRRPRAGGG